VPDLQVDVASAASLANSPERRLGGRSSGQERLSTVSANGVAVAGRI